MGKPRHPDITRRLHYRVTPLDSTQPTCKCPGRMRFFLLPSAVGLVPKGQTGPSLQARSYACRRGRIGPAMNFVLQPLATPARHPGSGRPKGRRIASSLTRGAGRQGCTAKPTTPATRERLRRARKNASLTLIYHPDGKRSATPRPPASSQGRRTRLSSNPAGRRRFRYALAIAQIRRLHHRYTRVS